VPETYPEIFEHPLLESMHQAFLKAVAHMEEIGTQGKNYWDILHAAQSLLEAMCKIEDAAFEWRSYEERLEEGTEDE
jgi:hypothetical protein